MNKNTSISSNNSKRNIFSLAMEIKSPKTKNNNNITYNIIEPVKQDEQKINDCFEEIDKEIKKSNNNIFKEDDYDNIIIMESKKNIIDDENSNK